MQRFQQSFNAFIERFQERWETQPSFRATWGTVGAGSFLLILCVCALMGSNLLAGALVGFGNVSKGKVIIGGNNTTSTFPIATLAPQAPSLANDTPQPVATSTYAPSPTPTVTPNVPTPSPTTVGGPTGPTFQVAAQPSPVVWKRGQQAQIVNISTSATPPIANVTMTITLQFGSNPACVPAGPVQVQLDATGKSAGTSPFTVPTTCADGNEVTATYQVPGYSNFTDSTTFHSAP